MIDDEAEYFSSFLFLHADYWWLIQTVTAHPCEMLHYVNAQQPINKP